MMSSTKGAIVLAIIGIIGVAVKMLLQARVAREAAAAARQAAADKLLADAEVAKLRREAEERLARHAREAEERVEEAAERKAEREQKEKLIAQLQASTAETLAILRNELLVRDAASARSFEYLDRNTRATEKLAEMALSQAAEMKEIRGHVAELKGGAGCRLDSRRPSA